MKTLIIILSGLVSGYIASNLEDKELAEVLEEIVNKSEYWYEEIQKFLGETIDGIEGVDSETIKLNIDAFVGALTDSVEEFLQIEEFDDRMKYVEDKLAEVTENLLERINKIQKLEKGA